MAKQKLTPHDTEDGEPLAKIGRRGVLSFQKKQSMFAVAVRNPIVFEYACKVLKETDIAQMGEFYAVIWRSVRKCYKQFKALPDAQIIMGDINNELTAYPTVLTEDECSECEEFIKGYIFNPDVWQNSDIGKSDVHAKDAVATVRKFKDELVATDLSKLIRDGTVASNLTKILADNQIAIARAAIDTDNPTDELFDDGWDTEVQPKLMSTGLTVLDEFIGGQTAGEVYLFFGPFSSCKTTLAIQAFCLGVLSAHARTVAENTVYANQGKKKRVLYKAAYASYETKKTEVRQRCLAFLANIPRSRMLGLSSVTKLNELRRTGELPLQEYEEKVLYADKIKEGADPATLDGEWERVTAAVELIRKHGIFLDMTSVGSETNPKGCGGMQELAERLTAQVQLDKCQITVVWIDHLAAMVDNMIGADEKFTDDNKRHLLKRAPKQAVDFIATPLKCPVWILHQFSGSANERGSTAQFHHTDGDECKSVGMFADFCIVTGPATKDGKQLCVFDVTKFRRKPPNNRQIVRIDGEYNRIVHVSDTYCIEGNTIMTHAEAKGVGGSIPTPKSSKPVTGGDVADTKPKKKAAPTFKPTKAKV